MSYISVCISPNQTKLGYINTVSYVCIYYSGSPAYFQNASLAVAAFAISSEREEAIDFTKPYKAKTLTVLVKRTPDTNSIFEFLYPLAPEVWGLMFCSVITLGILLFVLDIAIPNSKLKDERFSLKV